MCLTNPSSDVLERSMRSRISDFHEDRGDWTAMEREYADALATIERLSAALRNIAEGNLGDAAWQANYDRNRAFPAQP